MRPTQQPSTIRLSRTTKTALALAALVALSGQAPEPLVSPDELVRQAADAPRHVSYVGQLQSTRWGASRALATIVRVEHLAPNETRRTYLAPESLYGEYVVTHGTTTTEFDTKHDRMITSENFASENAVAFNDNIALLSANYRAVSGPDEPVAGRAARTVSLVNRHTGERMMRLWIDAQTDLVLAKESYHADGSLASRMRFDEIRYTGDIPASFFSLDVPAGYRIERGRNYSQPSSDIERAVKSAGFTPIGPKYLPDGFSIISANVSEIKSIKSLHLLYSDGMRNLSLFENDKNAPADFGAVAPSKISFEGHEASYVKDGPTTLLSWREHGLAFALVGDLDIKELVEIAKSVVP